MDRVVYNFETLAVQAHAAAQPSQPRTTRDFRAPNPRIGVIYNPRSHRNKGQDLACTARASITVAQPRTREDIAGALADFAARGIDYLIINGGDGTVRDVLTMGQGVFGDNWPALAILPKGKTNALNVDLGAPSGWNLPEAIAAYADGHRIVRRPLVVAREGAEEPAMLGFIFGAGAFTLGIEAGQDAHQLGFFNSLAVGATSVWGVMQALFGSDANVWRRGTQMQLVCQPSGTPLPHSGHGDLARRNIILVSTLKKLPMGIKLFGAEREGLKLAVLDKPRRRVLLALPAILLGWQPKWLAAAGLHQLDATSFTLDVAEPVILDGEAFPAGRYAIGQGPELTFVTP
ncbi:diacylglycerol/lipid kinase family protein [Erythrobacter mangrovi]|uniref:Acylglycerol kinase family protein n=1 Tax=Erythrobacter mangrovi TaxID=2739433 RepID=A0A7D3X983_9SPHN|nr:acylglycerol kinase family protein [Erythrobacter mangrovi]QKG70835.1 acylglycerol kinase family protein [Erythrobacter mangrovi]